MKKGLDLLLRAWDDIDYKLKIIGDGPLKDYVKNNDNPNIEYLGFKDHEGIFSEMQKCFFLVFPSTWYEEASYGYPRSFFKLSTCFSF